MNRFSRLRRAEGGFTLVELLVAAALMVLVSVVIGGILINTLNAEKTVRTTTHAASAGQLVATSIERGVRNADQLRLDASGGEYFLTAHTAAGGTTLTWNCQAWFIGGGAAYTRVSPSAIARPSVADLTGWTELATGLAPSGSAAILSRDDRRIHITFEVAAGDAQPVLISTSAVSRQTVTEGTLCG